MPSGEELLIADTADRDREGLKQLFDRRGYVCTGVADPESAQDVVRRKFFPVALVDLDFGGPGGGLALIQHMRVHSAPTKVVLMTGRRSFEAAVEALRAGVVDIVSKRPDQVDHLALAVQRAMDRYRSGDKDSALLREVRGVLDEAFKIVLSMYRKVHGGNSTSSLTMKPTILIVDEDQAFLQEAATLLQDYPWEVSLEMTGGAGLDRASTFSFQILAVRERLMDLPGHMLIRSAQAQRGSTLGLLYDSEKNTVQRYEGGRPTGRAHTFESAADLVKALERLASELSTMQEERRYLQAFRGEHGNFLKRYADLKSRIDAASE